MELKISLENGAFTVSGDMDATNAIKALALLFKSICGRKGIPPYLEYGKDTEIKVDSNIFDGEVSVDYPPFVLQAEVAANRLDLQTWCAEPEDMVKGLLAICKWDHTVLHELIGFHDTVVLQAFVASMKDKSNISLDNIPLGTGDLLRRFVKELPMNSFTGGCDE